MAVAHVRSEFRSWGVAGHAIRVEYAVNVLEEICADAVDGLYQFRHGGMEIGGVLFGEADGDLIRVSAYRSLDCEHAFGPRFVLSDRDRAELKDLLYIPRRDGDLQGLEPVGWYHSHTRSGIELSPRDLEIYNSYFPQRWQIALVVRPDHYGPARCGFFFREPDNTIHAESSYEEFSVQSSRPHVPAESEASPEDESGAEAVKPAEERTPARVATRSAKPTPAPSSEPVRLEVPGFAQTPKAKQSWWRRGQKTEAVSEAKQPPQPPVPAAAPAPKPAKDAVPVQQGLPGLAQPQPDSRWKWFARSKPQKEVKPEQDKKEAAPAPPPKPEPAVKAQPKAEAPKGPRAVPQQIPRLPRTETRPARNLFSEPEPEQQPLLSTAQPDQEWLPGPEPPPEVRLEKRDAPSPSVPSRPDKEWLPDFEPPPEVRTAQRERPGARIPTRPDREWLPEPEPPAPVERKRQEPPPAAPAQAQPVKRWLPMKPAADLEAKRRELPPAARVQPHTEKTPPAEQHGPADVEIRRLELPPSALLQPKPTIRPPAPRTPEAPAPAEVERQAPPRPLRTEQPAARKWVPEPPPPVEEPRVQATPAPPPAVEEPRVRATPAPPPKPAPEPPLPADVESDEEAPMVVRVQPRPMRKPRPRPAPVAPVTAVTHAREVPTFGQAHGHLSRKWRWIIIAVLLIGAAGFGVQQYFASSAPQPLSLRVSDMGGQLLIEWDRAAKPVVNAKSATLIIKDGTDQAEIQLDAERLYEGAVDYARHSDIVDVRLRVDAGGKPAEESIRFIGQPVQRGPTAEEAEVTRQRDELKAQVEQLQNELQQKDALIRKLRGNKPAPGKQ